MIELSFKFRVPGEPTALRTLLARAWPNVTRRQITAALRARKIRVGRRTVQDAGKLLQPGSLVHVSAVPPGEASEVHSQNERYEQCFSEYRILTPSPPWPSGTLRPNKNLEYSFQTIESRSGISALKVTPSKGTLADILEHMASLDMAAFGDAHNAGILVDGGLRVQDFNEEVAADFWPNERAFPSASKSRKSKNRNGGAVLDISPATASIISRGHPWVLADKGTGDTSLYRPGTLVHLNDPRGVLGATARISGSTPLVARVWQSDGRGLQFAASLEERIYNAFQKREALNRRKNTNAYRVIHGEADGLPGLAVDRLGSVFRLLYSSRCLEPVRDRINGAIRSIGLEILGQVPTLVEVIQLRNRPQGELECVRLVEGNLPKNDDRPGFFIVEEAGLQYWVEPGLNEIHRPRPGYGLFIDQRVNRERVCGHAKDKRWLNLFCHTGAFSVALLHAGAAEVVSVDLSRPYLHWLEANLDQNNIDKSKHRSIKQDARRYLERLGPGDHFDGIILDPPTAASSGRRFWSVKKEVGQLIGLCFSVLKENGELLVTRNDRRARGKLEGVIEEIAKASKVQLKSVKSAPPGPDFPRIKGFPEGDSFQGVLAKLR